MSHLCKLAELYFFYSVVDTMSVTQSITPYFTLKQSFLSLSYVLWMPRGENTSTCTDSGQKYFRNHQNQTWIDLRIIGFFLIVVLYEVYKKKIKFLNTFDHWFYKFQVYCLHVNYYTKAIRATGGDN